MIRPITLIACLLLSLAPVASAEVLTVTGQLPGGSDVDAIDQTRAQAARELLPVLQTRVEVLARQRGVQAPAEAILVKLIESELSAAKGAFVPTVRTVDRPYGIIYYADARLDLSGRWLSDLAERAVRMARADRQMRWASVGAGAALIAVIGLVYFAANALTKGYYRLRLRLTALAVSAAGIAAVTAVYLGLA